MAKEFVFWFKLIKRSAFYYNSMRIIPENLIKVVVTKDQIRSNRSITPNKENFLALNLSDISDISWSVSSKGSVGVVKICTHDSGKYYLTPVNPLEPTLQLISNNRDELIAFCNVIKAFKTNQPPEIDENPYIRQFSKKAKPTYLEKEEVIHRNKQISPLDYYYKYEPKKEEKKRHLVIKIYFIIELIALILSIIMIPYILFNMTW